MKAAKLGNEDVTFSDRISHLPDDLLLRILSLVPVSDAMNTSLLSKRWKSVWKMMPTLEYDEESCPNIGSLGFVKFCRRSLRLHEAPLLKTPNLKRKEHSESIDSLIFPTSSRNNRRVFHNLVVLKLHTVLLYSSPRKNFSPVCFRSLKSLHLTRVTFQSGESLCRLISACPVLEGLFLQRVSTSTRFFRGRSSFTISVPSLQRLEISDSSLLSHDSSGHDSRFEINAPSLKFLMVKSFIKSLNFTEDMPRLLEAHVIVDLSQTDKFLRFLTSVKFLSIHLYASKVLLLADQISHRLLHLELYIIGRFSRNLLLHLLKHSPKLQVLKLQVEEIRLIFKWPTYPNRLCHVKEIKDQPPSVCDPSSVPECLSFHLETFQWSDYQGTDEEKEFAVYILQNAPCLKTAAISIHWRGPRGEEKDQKIKELKSMPMASTSCQLVIRL